MSENTTIEKYFTVTNEVIGVLSIGIGLGCFSAQNTKFYAWFGLIFVILAWWSGFSNYRTEVKRLREQGHPDLSVGNIFKRCYVAFLGWLFLGCIAIGILDTKGFSL
ncbi:hypothetical protein ACNPKB_16395 [Shewanella marisflavi]|uniref:hypothetical protein n=1 Tax=Shewanella marisflavi TaxID=260364 RepID=UPI003AB06CFA